MQDKNSTHLARKYSADKIRRRNAYAHGMRLVLMSFIALSAVIMASIATIHSASAADISNVMEAHQENPVPTGRTAVGHSGYMSEVSPVPLPDSFQVSSIRKTDTHPLPHGITLIALLVMLTSMCTITLILWRNAVGIYSTQKKQRPVFAY